MKPNRNVRLGRGLDALIPTNEPAPAPRPAEAQEVSREFFRCSIDLIIPSTEQPRKDPGQSHLEDLVESIKTQGIIQPLVVRKDGERYMLIAGERRWRAAGLAGLKEVPVVVRETSKREAFELALVENLQREDLNPIEEAEAYRRLQEEFGYTQENLAVRVSKDRATVANALRLLFLPDPVRVLVERGDVSAGHARALLALKDPEAMLSVAKEIIAQGLSVRQTEAMVKRLKPSEEKGAKPKEPAIKESANVRALADELVVLFGTKVDIRDKGPKKGGSIEIAYSSYAELDRLLALFRQEKP